MIDKTNVIYLHGFASSAKNSKAEWLRQKNEKEAVVNFYAFDFNPLPIDFSQMTITGMVNRLRQHVLVEKIENPFLVGSSLGGLVALHYARLFGGVERLLLLAPALRFNFANHSETPESKERGYRLIFHYAFNRELPLYRSFLVDGRQYKDLIEPPVPITILHGRQDEVVPIRGSQLYAKRYPDQVKLVTVESDHRMGDQVDVIWEWIKILSS
jgi:pimeloyl-ACP methyl ester carboxylesterase